MFKNWVMIGFGIGFCGKIIVIDMDFIEKSNFNRQFFFRFKDVGQMKSDCVVRVVQVMNFELVGYIVILKDCVSFEIEYIFNEDFWNDLDGVINVFDNVEVRIYVDRRCVFFYKFLLESGIFGIKGNIQVVFFKIIELYFFFQDFFEQFFFMCILCSFFNKIEYIIVWVCELFESLFVKFVEIVNFYFIQFNYFEIILKQGGNEKVIFEMFFDYFKNDWVFIFEDCVQWGCMLFEK